MCCGAYRSRGQPSLLRSCYLYQNAPRLSVSLCDYGLAQLQSTELAFVEQYGCAVLYRGFEWTSHLKESGVRISMDGRGRWMDNRMIERLWRSLKYECIYLNSFETCSEVKAGIGPWIDYYNSERSHSTHGILTPDEAYETPPPIKRKAA